MSKNIRIRESRSDRIFNTINVIIMLVMIIIVLYPLYFVVIASFSEPMLVNSGQVLLFPKKLTLEGYERMLQNEDLWLGYGNSLFYMAAGTLVSLVITIPAAFALSYKHTRGKKFFTVVFTFTMIFGGGMIPTYLIIKGLGWLNTRWILIVNGSFSVYNLIVARTFMYNIPTELLEAADIDGASVFQCFFKVVLPLSKAIIAVMTLYYGIAHWFDYFTALIYVSEEKYVPLQMVLRRILIQSSTTATMSADSAEGQAVLARISELVKYSVIIAATLPAMVMYPFVQKHFVKGVMMGAVKG